jgi:hypothetical protein
VFGEGAIVQPERIEFGTLALTVNVPQTAESDE